MNKSELEEKLGELAQEIKERHLAEREIVIHGTGNTSELYQKCISREELPVIAYADNNPAKQGSVYHGLPVWSVDDVSGEGKFILVCSLNCRTNIAICEQLRGRGLEAWPLDAYVFGKNYDKIMRAMEMLADAESRNIYADMILKRIANEPVTDFSPRQYFAVPAFAGEAPGEVFVDMGAFVGDTVERYLFERSGTFGKIYAFEPYLPNYQAMQVRFARLRQEWGLLDDQLLPICGGVGRETGMSSIEAGNNNGGFGAGFRENGTGNLQHIYALDEYFKDIHVDFLKADIESYELDMLWGAEKVLRRDRPKLALAIYHNASDMYTIINFLAEMDLGYNFALRQHSPTYAETVLYAWRE